MRGNHKSQTQGDDRGAHGAARSARAGGSAKEAGQVGGHSIDDPKSRADPVDRAVKPDEGEETRSSPGTVGEDELIRQSLAGDQQAFEVLVRRFSPRVFNIIASFFRRRDMVEDIAQEVFARAYFSLSSFTLGRSFEAWVAKIAVNACYDQLRAQRRRSEYEIPRTAEQEGEWLELQMLEAARDRHQSAERQRDAIEISERLLSKLDPEDRLVLVLMDRDGYSVKEVSDLTGWGQSKVKVRAFRARRALRAEMKRLVLSAERKQRNKR